MPLSPKLVIYRVARALGMFRIARVLTRRRIRILAYHGFAERDEARFRPKLFITGAVFARRLAFLQRAGYRVITLDDAVRALAGAGVTPDSVVITIDDGYASTLNVAAPLLERHGFPATVYLTSYYMQKQTPVHLLFVSYLVWKSQRTTVELQWRALPPITLDLATPGTRQAAIDAVMHVSRTLTTEEERLELSRVLAASLAVDFDDALAAQAFRLMTPAEARAALVHGVSIGLHTHRHRFPHDDLPLCRQEIEDNRAYLSRELGVEPRHFCYPSGVYSRDQFDVLRQAGVDSATTCDIGLARAGDSPYELRRFLDGEMVTDLEFEAELSGFSELLRTLLKVDRTAAGVSR